MVPKAMKKFISFLLSLVLLLLGAVSAYASGAPGGMDTSRSFGKNSPGFISQATAVMQENWQENYFSSIEMTIGESGLMIDGREMDAETVVIENGELMLPIDDIAAAMDIEITEASLVTVFSMRRGDRRRASVKTTEQALNVNVHRDGDRIAITKPFQTKQLIVQTSDGSRLANTYGAVESIDNGHGLHLLRYSSERNAKRAQDELLGDSLVRYAEPNVVVSVDLPGAAEHNIDDGWVDFADGESVMAANSLLSNRWGSERIAADRFKEYLHENEKTETQLMVAILDTGADYDHVFLHDRIRTDLGFNFVNNTANARDDHWHGTHVSGTLVDCSPSNVKIIPIKVLDRSARGYVLAMRFGIEYAADNEASIINMSVGSTAADARQTLQDAVDYAINLGAACVVAAGNDSVNAGNTHPASFSNVITVSATDINDRPAAFTNFGNGLIDVAAPGVNILSSVPGGNYRQINGTSMAAPHVSAAVAMLKLDDMSATPEQLKQALKNTSRDFGNPTYYGAGIVDFNVYFITATSDFVYGSVTGSGEVGPADLVRLARWLAGHPGIVIDKRAAKVTGNDEIGPADLVRLARYIAGHPGVTLGG